MLKYITALMAASVALVGALENPAHSASGIWAEIDGWTIQAETDFMSCEAYAPYNSGLSLSFVYDGSGWLFSIIGYDVIPTFEYETKFTFDGGSPMSGSMLALADDTLVIVASDNFIKSVATSYLLEVDGRHGFNLSGSAKALAETVACQHTLNELLPNTNTSTGAESWGWDRYNERI